jgi:hypothetical protein
LALRKGSLTATGARTTCRVLWCSEAEAIWIVEPASSMVATIVRIVFRIFNLPCSSAWLARPGASPLQRFVEEITVADVNYYTVAHHETASKSVDQGSFAAKYSAGGRIEFLDFLWPIRFNGGRTARLSGNA